MGRCGRCYQLIQLEAFPARCRDRPWSRTPCPMGDSEVDSKELVPWDPWDPWASKASKASREETGQLPAASLRDPRSQKMKGPETKPRKPQRRCGGSSF